jgi:hypothetical protein
MKWTLFEDAYPLENNFIFATDFEDVWVYTYTGQISSQFTSKYVGTAWAYVDMPKVPLKKNYNIKRENSEDDQ